MGTYSDAHICHCLSLLSTLRRNSVVTVAGNRPKTGKEFVDRVMGLAHGLLQLGLQSGDVVSIAAFNSELYLEWLLAIAYVGAVAAPLNYRWSYEEAVLAMEVVRPAMLVSDDSCVSWYSKLQQNDIPSLRWHVLLDPSSDFVTASNVNVLTTETIRKQSGRDASLDYCWAAENAVIICFTSDCSLTSALNPKPKNIFQVVLPRSVKSTDIRANFGSGANTCTLGFSYHCIN